MTFGVKRLEHHRRQLVAVVLVVAALVVGVGVGVDAHASTAGAHAAGTRVAAHHHLAADVVAASEDITAGESRRTTTHAADVAIGSRVAPNTAGGVRLRPGTAQPGVARTYESALNPQGYIDDVASAYGINLRGSGQQIQAVYNPNLVSAGRVRAAAPNVIEIGPLGMSSSDELARTLAHELNHSRSFLRGGSAPEATAYGAEDMLSAWLRGDL